MFEVTYLNQEDKVDSTNIQAFTEKQARDTALNLSEVRAIINIEQVSNKY